MSNWQLISKKTAYHHPHRLIEEWQMKVPNGDAKNFSILIGKEVVVVFGITADNQVLLIHQYYVAHGAKVPSMVAGFVDGADSRVTAIAELREEAGCVAKDMIYLGASLKGKYATGGFIYYLALDIKQVEPQALEPSEDIDVAFVSLGEFLALLRAGKLQDVSQVACAYRALDYLHLIT